MKYLLTSDLHLDTKQPACWHPTKDYGKWSLDKLRYLQDKAHQYNVDAILLPGDFFNRPVLPYEFINDVRDIINRSGMFWVTTLGQHDIRGHNTDTYRNSAIGCLESKNFVILRRGDDAFESVVGYGWGDVETDTFLTTGSTFEEVAIIHASIGTHNIEWLLNKEPTLPGLVLFGDIHPGFGPVHYKDTILLNLGSWSKNKIDEKWELRYAIYDTDSRELVIHKAEGLDQDVFDPEYIKKLEDDKAMAAKIDMEAVSVALAKLKEKSSESVEVRLTRMAEALSVPKSVVKRVVSELATQ